MNDADRIGSAVSISLVSLLERIDRLRSLSQSNILTDWRLNLGSGSVDADPRQWELVSLNPKGQIVWERGRQEIWLAQQLSIPAALHGYAVTSLSCRLALTWWAETAQVFVDGELVQEGDLFDHSPRV